jgi:hypothetical protein
MTYMGRPAKYKFKASFARVGQVELEMIEPLEGPTIYADYLLQHGEGANHIRSMPDTMAAMDKNVEIMSGRGFPLVMGGHDGNEVGFAYIGTTSALKTIWEAVKMPDGPPNIPAVVFPANEKEMSPSKIKVRAISRAGIVVDDLEKAIGAYRDILSIGDWKISDPSRQVNIICRGKPVKSGWKTARADAGPVQLELIQPIGSENVFHDFLKRHGGGIHHLQFPVNDIKETKKIMSDQGFPVLMEGESNDGSFAFFDTTDKLKIVWEALQLT